MNETEIKAIQDENARLKQDAANTKVGIDGLLAQLEAHKQMLNGSLQESLTFRTNIIMMQNHLKDANGKMAAAEQTSKQQIDSLNQQLTDATAKIVDLESALKVYQ